MYLNIAGLRCHIDELKLMIEQTAPKIVILTETHITADHDVDEFEIPKYRFTVCLSRSAHTGGVAIYVDESLNCRTVSDNTFGDNWFLAVEVRGSSLTGIYGGVYHSPNCSHVAFVKSFEEWLVNVFVEEKKNVIAGDFNIRWNEAGCSRELKNVVDALGLKQHVSEPTRIGQSSSTIIDLVFSNVEECEARIVEELKISDHETICIEIGDMTEVNIPERGKQIITWKRYTKERLQDILRANNADMRTGVSVDDAAKQLSVSLVSAVEQLVDIVNWNPGRVNNNWYGTNLRMMKCERDMAYRTWKRTRNIDDLREYRLWRNSYVRELKATKNRSVQREVEDCNGDSKKVWKCLKSLIKPGGNASTEVIFDVKRSDDETAKLLNTFFVKSVEDIHNTISPPVTTIAEENVELESRFEQYQLITMTKLKETITSLKNCAGVYNITKRVMVDAFDIIGNQLLRIVNDSLRYGVFPEAWKKTVVIPIPKIPKSTKPEDHRPINILPLYEKVLETIVKEQLMSYVECTGTLIEEQSGFRKHHSCESALNLLLLKWKQYIEQGKIILAVFVDLKRAFETIDRQKLEGVLKRYGIHGTVLKWFHSYLENRVQVTKYNGCMSPESPIDLGVPQGSVLGPLLFILYINDVKRVLRRAEVNLFADDTVLFIVANSFDEAFSEMNSELHSFSEWLKWKKLKLNVAKTKCMVVTNRLQDNLTRTVQIEGEQIQRVATMKYLGVILDEKLNFNEHIDYTIRKAARKFGVLCRINRFLTADAKILIYKSIIAPHFDYCASILFLASDQQMKRMQILQNKVMRLILCCDRLTPRVFMLDCLQWMSVRQRVVFNTLVFVYRVTRGMAPQYLRNTVVYGRDVHRYETRQTGDLRVMNFRKACTQNSLFFKGYKLYNELPETAKQARTLTEFKRLCKIFVAERVWIETNGWNTRK